MNNAWTIEFTRIVVVVVTGFLFGLVSGYWLIAVFVPFAVYIGWTLVQIRALERWIRLGAKEEMAPDSNGIWQLIVSHIVYAQRKNSEVTESLSSMAYKLEAIISALPEATIVINANREIELTNKAAGELLGIDKFQDAGQKIDNLIREPKFLKMIESEEPREQIEIESPNNKLITLLVTCIDFGAEQRLITARDISQRIAVQKLRKAFIANASHELRTPLTVISGYLELLESEPEISAQVKKQIRNASQQANRMESILDALLMLSKLEEKGHDKQSGALVDVPVMLEKLVRDFSKTKAKGTHEFKVDLDHMLKIRAIEGEVYSLCQNLLSNAIKYSPPGSLIKICWQKDEIGYPMLSVEDNGEGIAPENISRLTERFFRVNVTRSRLVGGTGLGLSIVKHVLENHGGHLDIVSELGQGSTFTAYFPKYRICQ